MALRAVDGIRAAIGIRSLVADPVLVFGRPATAAEVAVLRVLAVRQLLQAAIVPLTDVRALSAAVDVLHGLSMVALLALRPRRYGEAAAEQVATAAVLVALEVRSQRG